MRLIRTYPLLGTAVLLLAGAGFVSGQESTTGSIAGHVVDDQGAAITYTDLGFATTNPNFGFPTNGGGSSATGYQAPLRVRLGARFEW